MGADNFGVVGKHTREVADRKTANSAVQRGQRDAVIAVVGLVFITSIVGFVWLQWFDLTTDRFDLGSRLAVMHKMMGAGRNDTYALLGAFAAIAIAAAVSLGATMRRAEALHAAVPAVMDSSDPKRDAEESPAFKWLRRRAAHQTIAMVQLVFLVAITSFTAVSGAAFAFGGYAISSIVAFLLAVFLFAEMCTALLASWNLDQLSVTPLPDTIAERLNDVAVASAARGTYRVVWMLVAGLAFAITFWVFVTLRDVLGGAFALGYLLLFALTPGMLRMLVSDSLLSTRLSRAFTVTMSAFMIAVGHFFIYAALLAAVFDGKSRADLEWWGVGTLVAFPTLLMFAAFDGGGMSRRWSAAVRRIDALAAPVKPAGAGTSRRPGRSSAFLLAVAVVPTAWFGLSAQNSAPVMAIGVCGSVGLILFASSRWKWTLTRFLLILVGGGLLLFSALVATRLDHLGGGVWGAILVLLAIAMLAPAARGTRTHALLTGAVDSAFHRIRIHRAAQWAKRLDTNDLIRETTPTGFSYRSRPADDNATDSPSAVNATP
ncbi:MAG TPA: hypothetical protein VN035_06010 [Microbacterium sp.]|nr:hypothetical protein [Microbacterium sp.]